jgi:hypothetical protein
MFGMFYMSSPAVTMHFYQQDTRMRLCTNTDSERLAAVLTVRLACPYNQDMTAIGSWKIVRRLEFLH